VGVRDGEALNTRMPRMDVTPVRCPCDGRATLEEETLKQVAAAA
jgi:hypothetical protein